MSIFKIFEDRGGGPPETSSYGKEKKTRGRSLGSSMNPRDRPMRPIMLIGLLIGFAFTLGRKKARKPVILDEGKS